MGWEEDAKKMSEHAKAVRKANEDLVGRLNSEAKKSGGDSDGGNLSVFGVVAFVIFIVVAIVIIFLFLNS